MKSAQIQSFSDPQISVFNPLQENTDQKKLRIWTLLKQCYSIWLYINIYYLQLFPWDTAGSNHATTQCLNKWWKNFPFQELQTK